MRLGLKTMSRRRGTIEVEGKSPNDCHSGYDWFV